MKKINITFSFRDETGDYSVKVFPFVIKCIVSVIVVFNFIVIAMALSCNPQLIVADEPTTALDVTIQAQVLELLHDLKCKINASIMLIINQGVRKSILTGSLTVCMTI